MVARGERIPSLAALCCSRFMMAPQHARKVPLAPIAARCVRCLRSKWPLEGCLLVIVYYRHHIYVRTYVRTHVYTNVRTYVYIRNHCILHAFREVGGLSVGAEINLRMGLGCQFIRRLRCFTTVGAPTIIDRLRVRTYTCTYVRIYVRTHT